MRQFPPTPPPASPAESTLLLKLGHKTGETTENVDHSTYKVITSYETFTVLVPVPARGSAHPDVTCPACNKRLRIIVPSAEARRRWMIMVIATMVALVLVGIGILIGAEDVTEGPPFATLVLLVGAEIGLINLLIFVEEKDSWVLNTKHKPL